MHAGATDEGDAEQPKTTQPPFSLRRAQRRGFRAYSASICAASHRPEARIRADFRAPARPDRGSSTPPKARRLPLRILTP